jgi:hypothetical protein
MARSVMARSFVRWDLSRIVEQVQSVCEVRDDGCWIWRYLSRSDELDDFYPSVQINGVRYPVSRLLLELTTGETGHTARHSCDRARCCNPDHLLWGTQLDNVRDMYERGHRMHAQPTVPKRVNRPYELARGERHGLAKLTEVQVIEMRAKAAAGVTAYRLGKDFGVTTRTATQIIRRATWAHVA